MKTKIVCTLGPQSDDEETIERLALAGMSVARLNMSHGTREYHAALIDKIRRVARKTGKVIGIMIDTVGPEVRLAIKKPITVKAGQKITLGGTGLALKNYKVTPAQLEIGETIIVDGGVLALEIVKKYKDSLEVKLKNNGVLEPGKSVAIPGARDVLPILDENDEDDIAFAYNKGVDFIAVSFIRNLKDIHEVKKISQKYGGEIPFIAKIEASESIPKIKSIVKNSEGVMVARGDLGVERPISELPITQKRIIEVCKEFHRPVMIATDLLGSMEKRVVPSRAEVADISEAVRQQSDSIMLSNEIAVGDFPVFTLQSAAQICKDTENYYEKTTKVVTIVLDKHLEWHIIKNLKGIALMGSLKMARLATLMRGVEPVYLDDLYMDSAEAYIKEHNLQNYKIQVIDMGKITDYKKKIK